MSAVARVPRRRVVGPTGLAVGFLALIAYVPALRSSPGRMPADTKLYLYLDPGRLIADAPWTFDGRQFAGWVPHQAIAYLWPQGPWYWVGETVGLPDWVTHRLWIATLFSPPGRGVMWAARRLGLGLTAALAAAAVYQLTPYVLPYVSRTSAMLLPWAGLGWIVGLTVLAATRTRWRHAALAALVIATVGSVNATAIMMIAPAPVLWLLVAAAERQVSWRRALATAVRIGGLSLAVSLWWIAMLVIQGRRGADVLAYSESLESVSFTSTSPEVWRGLGYWLTYVRDAYAATTTAARDYMVSGRLIATGFVILLLAPDRPGAGRVEAAALRHRARRHRSRARRRRPPDRRSVAAHGPPRRRSHVRRRARPALEHPRRPGARARPRRSASASSSSRLLACASRRGSPPRPSSPQRSCSWRWPTSLC